MKLNKLEILLWVVCTCVPGLLAAALILALRRRTPPQPCSTGTGAECNLSTILPDTSADVAMCGAQPVACNLADVASCSACGDGWACTAVEANDTDYGVEGSFCLPEKPVTRCMQPSTNPNERVPGSWRWTGWMGTNKQAWTCACPYASFYPMDTTPNADTAGACLRSSNVCRGGTWTYPCKHPIRCDSTTCSLDLDSCETLTPDERNALVGADMWEFGHCACKPGDRVELDASTGVPICVPDTCSTLLRCTETTPCPGSATCVAGSCVRATSSCTEDSDCGDAGTCLEGTCTWGKWRTLPIVPYVFGACECPRACVSRGTRCEC